MRNVNLRNGCRLEMEYLVPVHVLATKPRTAILGIVWWQRDKWQHNTIRSMYIYMHVQDARMHTKLLASSYDHYCSRVFDAGGWRRVLVPNCTEWWNSPRHDQMNDPFRWSNLHKFLYWWGGWFCTSMAYLRVDAISIINKDHNWLQEPFENSWASWSPACKQFSICGLVSQKIPMVADQLRTILYLMLVRLCGESQVT